MSSSKRARACDACHSIKIKCELGSIGGNPPCERCVRLNKTCVVSPPKRQKDRVAELEAQVLALTRLLASQNIHPSDTANVDIRSPSEDASVNTTTSVTNSGKKRRLDSHASDESESTQHEAGNGVNGISLAELDVILPYTTQAMLVEKYKYHMPFRIVLALGDLTHEQLRDRYPSLLAAVFYAAAPGSLSETSQEALADITFAGLTKAIGAGQKSIDLLQAIQIVVVWYVTPRRHISMTVFHFIQASIKMSEDIGIRPTDYSRGPTGLGSGIRCSDAWRAWMVSRLLSSTMSLFMRKQSTFKWAWHDEANHFLLEYGEDGGETDRLLGQILRAEKICDHIANTSGSYDYEMTVDLSNTASKQMVQSQRNLITDWRMQVPPSNEYALLDLWEHYAMLLAHECVLHTPINKQSFAAPYIAERLSATDFPAPQVVSPDHVTALEMVRDSCHLAINLYTSLDTRTLVDLPATMFATKVIFAQWLLVKLFIALNGPGNTYGAYFDPSSLQIDGYLQKLIDTWERVKQIDPRCGSARILTSSPRMKEWLVTFTNRYVKSHMRCCPPNTISGTEQLFAPDFMANTMPAFDWPIFTMADDGSFGLEDLFFTTFGQQDFNPGPAMMPAWPAPAV